MQTKLTKRVAEATKVRPTDSFIWDTDVKGFGLKITPKDRRVFVAQYWAPHLKRVRRRVTLGTFRTVTVEQARAAARDLLARVARGEDPSRERSVRYAAPTLGDLAPRFLEDVKARRKPTTAREYTRILERDVIPVLASRRVSEIGPPELARLHGRLSETPIMANRVVQMLGAFFTWCEVHGHRPKHSNPAPEIERYAERSRERFLSGEEIARLGAALDLAERTGVPPAPGRRKKLKTGKTAKHRPKSFDKLRPANLFHLACIRFLLLSGWRESEGRTLRWDALDQARSHAILEDTKTGRSVRPLGAAVFLFLEGLPRVAESPYVFPGASASVPVVNLTRTWEAVRLAAGLKEVRLHDLRHTAASIAAAGGLSLPLIGALLGHRHPGTTARYAHLADDPRRLAADRLAGDVTAALAGIQRMVKSITKSPRTA